MTLATTPGEILASPAIPMSGDEADLERRFGGLRRLYGPVGYARLRQARVAVVGVGGVGSWVAEALARCGVAGLVLVDLDHVAESNINRQVQATSSTVGQAKVLALAERIAGIHPGCIVTGVEAFVAEDNWPAVLPGPVDALVDACDQVRAKAVIAAWSRAQGVPAVCVGAAGGKRRPQAVELDDLAAATHDPLLARLRQRLRSLHGAPRQGPIGVRVVFSREPVSAPVQACDLPQPGADAPAPQVDGSLNCHGYGSTVTVTATFGLVAANAVIETLVEGPSQGC